MGVCVCVSVGVLLCAYLIIAGSAAAQITLGYLLCSSRMMSDVICKLKHVAQYLYGPRERSRYSDSLRAGRSGVRISVGERFSTPVQTDPGVPDLFPWGEAAT